MPDSVKNNLAICPRCPNLGQMHVRIDDSNARVIRKNAEAYRRMFKRKKSFSTFVNEALRDLYWKRPEAKMP